jgi:hypothetical protein
MTTGSTIDVRGREGGKIGRGTKGGRGGEEDERRGELGLSKG